MLYLAALRRLREEVEEHSAYTNASGGYCVRNRATFIHAPSFSPCSSPPSSLLPRLTTISTPGEEVYEEHGRKKDRIRFNERAQDERRRGVKRQKGEKLAE